MLKNKFWDNVQYPLNELKLIDQDIINDTIDQFWKQIVKKIKPNNHILILFRVKTGDHYITIGTLQKLNLNEKDYFKKYVFELFQMKDDSYKSININEVIISYGVREGIINKPIEIKQTTIFENYKHFKLPITMNPLEYGYLIHQFENQYIIQIFSGTIATIIVNPEKQINQVYIHRDKVLAFEYKDYYINKNSFKRYINMRTYIYSRENENEDYKLNLLKIEKPVKYITPNIKKDKKQDKIITLDIETYNDLAGGIANAIPYLISWFDGTKHNSYYLTDFNNHTEMILKALSDLKRKKYHNYKIYVHNLAGFDGFFIIKELANIGILTPIIHNGKIISLKLTFMNQNESKSYSLLFLDSLQLLLTSLKKLCKAFKLTEDKGLFPHNFVNYNNLNYIGAIPSYDNFINLKYEEYQEYCKSFNNDWSLRDEAIKYCQQDCLTLYQIMNKFNDLMFNNLKIDMTKYPTLSSLAMALFRKEYLNEDMKLSMISGQVYKDIKQSYTGGATDMFIPTNSSNELVYAYDVNSLYPYVMANCKLPSGKPIYFEGDITTQDKEAFGFFYCKVIAPEDLMHPIIQLHIKTKSGIRTVAPTGTFETMLFSEEMYNAMKLGYKFEVLWGYQFEKQVIFKDYVNSLYNMRLRYDKSDPMNYICKILMNSLYGKFGMDDLFDTCQIVENENLDKFIGDKTVNDIIEIGDNFIVKIERDKTKTYLDNGSETHNVNISIASAITAYARIYMSQFKNNPALKLFYTDTDSIYTNLNKDQMDKLYPGMVSNTGLGKLKLEGIFSQSIFLAPKVYCLIDLNGNLTYKVKGLKKDVKLTFKDFESLLTKDNKLTKQQDKW